MLDAPWLLRWFRGRAGPCKNLSRIVKILNHRSRRLGYLECAMVNSHQRVLAACEGRIER